MLNEVGQLGVHQYCHSEAISLGDIAVSHQTNLMSPVHITRCLHLKNDLYQNKCLNEAQYYTTAYTDTQMCIGIHLHIDGQDKKARFSNCSGEPKTSVFR